jgi:hypothetical protein
LGSEDFTDSLHADAGGYAKIARMWATGIEGRPAQEKAASSPSASSPSASS